MESNCCVFFLENRKPLIAAQKISERLWQKKLLAKQEAREVTEPLVDGNGADDKAQKKQVPVAGVRRKGPSQTQLAVIKAGHSKIEEEK